MYCNIGKSNFRTQNIVNNMSVARSVVTRDGKYYIEFYTEWKDPRTKRMVSSKIVYIIDENLVHDLKQREKIESKSNS